MSDPPASNLFQQQEANRRRTTLLVIGFVAFFAWLGFGGDYIYHLYTLDAPRTAYHHTFPRITTLSTLSRAPVDHSTLSGPVL